MRPPEIVAEIGVNYYDIADKLSVSPVDAAKKMVAAGKESDVDAVKFQTYKAEKLAADNSPAYWDLAEEPTESQKELFSKFDKLTKDDYCKIATYCTEIGIEFMSTPFDNESASFINDLVSRHKIASADITNFPLLEQIAGFGKPILLSVGASTSDEVKEAVSYIRTHGCSDLTLLHCVLSYPTAFADANLWKIQELIRCFPECKIGYSDHTKFSVDVLTGAWMQGAGVIEKHFTLDKSLKGNDHYHAADPNDFKELFERVKFLQKVYGKKMDTWCFPCEKQAVRNARRGVYVKREAKRGEAVRWDDFVLLRPQLDGINPKEIERYIDKDMAFARNMSAGELVKKEDVV